MDLSTKLAERESLLIDTYLVFSQIPNMPGLVKLSYLLLELKNALSEYMNVFRNNHAEEHFKKGTELANHSVTDEREIGLISYMFDLFWK